MGFSRILTLLGLAVIISLTAAPAGAQKARVDLGRDLHRRSIDAYREGDYRTFLELTKRALEARPGHPSLVYNLAAAYALQGNHAEAVSWLTRYADSGLSADVEADSDFQSLSADQEFLRVASRLRENERAVTRSELAFSIPDSSFFAEGIAYDATTNSFFVSSIRRRSIVRIRDGHVEDFQTFDGGRSPLGLAVDSTNRRLWVSASVVSEVSTSVVMPMVVGFDLDSGEKISTTPGGLFLGDIAVGPRGDVYVSDPLGGMLYVLEGDSMSPVIPDGVLVSPQGIAVQGDALVVSDYTQGLYRIEPASGAVEKLTTPPGTVLLGIDGLVSHEGDVVAIQNGVRPQRVLRIHLADEQIGAVEVLERNHPNHDEPTTGVVAGDTLYYIANGQWGKLTGTASEEPVILKMSLTPPRARPIP